MKIFIGIPAFNEEKNISSIILKIKEKFPNIIVCNDGSTDMTKKIIEELNVITINHEKNLGYGAGIRSLFLKAKELNADILVTFDADGQHRIEDIEKVIQPILNNKSDIVIGSRFLDENEKNVPKYRKVGIKVITKITNSSIKQKLTDSQSGFRAYSKNVLSGISPTEVGMGISTEILIKASSKNYIISEVPIIISYEGETSTHNPIRHGTSVIASTIKYISIKRPLTFFGIPCIIFFIFGGMFAYYTIENYVDVGRLNTNLAIISMGLILLGIIFLISIIIIITIITVVEENKKY